MKSKTCFEEMLEQYLPHYSNEYDMQNFPANVINKYDLEDRVHQTMVIQSEKCDRCTGRDGGLKKSYTTKTEAIAKSKLIYLEQGIDLRIYRCKHGGWHLTKGF